MIVARLLETSDGAPVGGTKALLSPLEFDLVGKIVFHCSMEFVAKLDRPMCGRKSKIYDLERSAFLDGVA